MPPTPYETAGGQPLSDPGDELYVYGTDASEGGPVLRVNNPKRGYSRTIEAAELERIIRLTAAAPDLLAALKAILAHPRTDDRSIVFMPDEAAAARAAIAKATAP